jgi:hypothetical protein
VVGDLRLIVSRTQMIDAARTPGAMESPTLRDPVHGFVERKSTTSGTICDHSEFNAMIQMGELNVEGPRTVRRFTPSDR